MGIAGNLYTTPLSPRFTLDNHSLTWYNTRMTNTIITTAMLAAILLPIIMIGVADAKRHPWFK